MRLGSVVYLVVLAFFAVPMIWVSMAAGSDSIRIESKNGFQPVAASAFEQVKKLERSAFGSDLKMEDLSVQDFRSENHLYRVLRFCIANETGECLTSFYRDAFADKNLHVATILPGITVAEYESSLFCRDCGTPYVVRFISPTRPLSTFSCSTLANFTDDGALLGFDPGCSN